MVPQRAEHARGAGFSTVQIFRIDKPLAAPVFRPELVIGNHFAKNRFHIGEIRL